MYTYMHINTKPYIGGKKQKAKELTKAGCPIRLFNTADLPAP